MVKINLTNVIVAVGAGAVDEVLEYMDGKATTPVDPMKFGGKVDYGRVGLTALAYLGQIFNIMPEYAGPLAQSETTLLTKTVGRIIRLKSVTGMPRASAIYQPNMRSARLPVSGRYGGIASTPKEFENIQLI